jgi:hypothetical protein
MANESLDRKRKKRARHVPDWPNAIGPRNTQFVRSIAQCGARSATPPGALWLQRRSSGFVRGTSWRTSWL